MTRDGQAIWIAEKARAAGFSDAHAFATHFELRQYRMAQIYRAAVKELLGGFDAVTTLPKEMRARLHEAGISFSSVEPSVVQHSVDGQTTKALFRLKGVSALHAPRPPAAKPPGPPAFGPSAAVHSESTGEAQVEAVLMEHRGDRTTVCISSQAGCAFACAFCATGQGGFSRHLRATEIFDQARFFAIELAKKGKKITNVVFMGMGEPFHNYEAVMDAVALFNDPHGFGLGHRHITISTVGLVDKIDRFAEERLQVNLAISLHAPNDEVRGALMPVNRKFPLAELMAACERFVRKTNRKVFFEYVLLRGMNDSEQHGRELARLMAGRLYHVNLIPYNATPDGAFSGTDNEAIWRFAGILDAAGVPVTVRQNMGRDIAAACGQLRVETQRKTHKAAALS